MAGLLCEEEGPGADNVKYCGYCKHHYNKMVRRTTRAEEGSETPRDGHELEPRSRCKASTRAELEQNHKLLFRLLLVSLIEHKTAVQLRPLYPPLEVLFLTPAFTALIDSVHAQHVLSSR